MHQEFQSQVGCALEKIRVEAGLSKSKLASLLFCDRRQIQRMESGDRSIDMVDLLRLSAVYQMEYVNFVAKLWAIAHS